MEPNRECWESFFSPLKNAEKRGNDGRGDFSTTNDTNHTNEGEGGLEDLKLERREKLSMVSCHGRGAVFC